MGKRMFVMHHIGNYKLAPKANLNAIKTFEQMHVKNYILVLRFSVLSKF
jgi:hypothetical protein